MSIKQSYYNVLKPVHLDGLGTVQPGDSVKLHPRQATYLVTGGVLRPVDATAEKPVKKETAK